MSERTGITLAEAGYLVCPACNGDHHEDDTAAWKRCSSEES